ncbi:MAG: tRNA (adenosine(37)-N6)-threonylcarbamoyltransferase complex ATPase subunit type 1 TsaE [Candidatus Aminicenantes bacterium]|nr:tRNA (adenosine(37)-N6)-threonylcarbamoyltransferase complex ATPase subunit type 1 TsaE [Candidatus Aminicenantes bacterium]
MTSKYDDIEMQNKRYVSHSEAETIEFAKNLAAAFKGDEVVLLQGELGAGKTVFTKGLAAGLGMEDVTQVCSPSFTLINIYQARVPIFHMDLYRLGTQADISTVGWEDYLGQGVLVVEWAEKLDYEEPAIRIAITVGKNEERTISIV